MSNNLVHEGGAIYGHMGVNTPDSNKIYKKLYQNTPLNRKLKRVGKPYGYIHKERSPKKSSVSVKQRNTAVKSLGKLRKDYKKCSVGYAKGKKLSAKKLAKLYKDCRKYSPKLIRKKTVKRSDLIGTRKSPKSGALKQYSQVIRKKILQANKVIIDYQQQHKKTQNDDVVIDKVVSNSQKLENRRKLAEKRGEIIMIDSSPQKSGRKSRSPKRTRSSKKSRSSKRTRSPKRRSSRRKRS